VLQEAELSGHADSKNTFGGSSETMYFIGLDVHKKTISDGPGSMNRFSVEPVVIEGFITKI
jgi:hypothetical protein